MHPLLFKLGPFAIHTYGLVVAVGFLTAVEVAKAQAARAGLDRHRVADMAFWVLLVGFCGARTLYMCTRGWDYFMSDPMQFFRIWEGGLVFFGGPLAVVPWATWYLKRHRVPVWPVLDAMTPGLVIAHAIGRVGCVFSGCCYGRPTTEPWGIILDHSPLVEPALRHTPLHPVQLYESFSLLLLFALLIALSRRRIFPGAIAVTYLVIYPLIRSVVETYRGDLARGFIIEPWLSTSQFISALVLFAGVGLGAVRWRHYARLGVPTPRDPVVVPT